LFVICNMLGTDRSKVGVMNKLMYKQTDHWNPTL
jgi:hypothetical protein